MKRGATGRQAIGRVAKGVKAGAARLRPLADRRRFGRFKGSRLGCNLGKVMDLSGGGVRIRGSGRLGGRLEVQLWTARRRITLPAKVVWVRRIGFRKYEAGLEFMDLTPEMRQDLGTFAAYLAAG